MGSRIRKNPYAPILDIKPVSSMVTPVGASAYVDGSHVWNGTSGVLTANPTKAPAKMTAASVFSVRKCQPSFTESAEESVPLRPNSDNCVKSNLSVEK